jgi:hypothetical protein
VRAPTSSTVVRHARVALTTLREAIGDEEFFDITVQLSPEFGELWVRR